MLPIVLMATITHFTTYFIRSWLRAGEQGERAQRGTRDRETDRQKEKTKKIQSSINQGVWLVSLVELGILITRGFRAGATGISLFANVSSYHFDRCTLFLPRFLFFFQKHSFFLSFFFLFNFVARVRLPLISLQRFPFVFLPCFLTTSRIAYERACVSYYIFAS